MTSAFTLPFGNDAVYGVSATACIAALRATTARIVVRIRIREIASQVGKPNGLPLSRAVPLSWTSVMAWGFEDRGKSSPP